MIQRLARNVSDRQPHDFSARLRLCSLDQGSLIHLQDLLPVLAAQGRSGRWIEVRWLCAGCAGCGGPEDRLVGRRAGVLVGWRRSTGCSGPMSLVGMTIQLRLAHRHAVLTRALTLALALAQALSRVSADDAQVLPAPTYRRRLKACV